jgi:hypothetical protein
VRFARKHCRGASRTRIRAALVAEAAWRKALHRDFPVPLSAVWRGDLFHTDARR